MRQRLWGTHEKNKTKQAPLNQQCQSTETEAACPEPPLDGILEVKEEMDICPQS